MVKKNNVGLETQIANLRRAKNKKVREIREKAASGRITYPEAEKKLREADKGYKKKKFSAEIKTVKRISERLEGFGEKLIRKKLLKKPTAKIRKVSSDKLLRSFSSPKSNVVPERRSMFFNDEYENEKQRMEIL